MILLDTDIISLLHAGHQRVAGEMPLEHRGSLRHLGAAADAPALPRQLLDPIYHLEIFEAHAAPSATDRICS